VAAAHLGPRFTPKTPPDGDDQAVRLDGPDRVAAPRAGVVEAKAFDRKTAMTCTDASLIGFENRPGRS
jgi:hypothetical protein